MKTLENASQIYCPAPKRVVFFYSCKWFWCLFGSYNKVATLGFQEIYTTLREKLAIQGIQCDFIEGSVITEADLDAVSDPNGGQTLIIIDDNSIAVASSKEMAHVFTMARHKNCSIVLLLHFIFGPWPTSRIISGNTAYFFLLKSPRMAKQVSTLGSQISKQRQLVSAYEREMRKPYGYVLVDLCTKTPEHQRIRTNIFDGILSTKPAVAPISPKPLTHTEPEKQWIKYGPPPKKSKVISLPESVIDEDENGDEDESDDDNQENDDNESANSNDEYDIDDNVEDESDDSEIPDYQQSELYKRCMRELRRRKLKKLGLYNYGLGSLLYRT